MTTRVLLVDDHSVVRSGIRSILNERADMQVVGEASNGQEALSRARELSPQVVVMDVNMPVMNGIDATRILIREIPGVKVIAFSVNSDLRSVSEMLKAGATGFVTKEASAAELAQAIKKVASGERYLGRSAQNSMVGGVLDDEDGVLQSNSSLSARERQVLQGIAEGRTSKEISAVLDLSVKTVDYHKQNLKDKLDIHTVAGLTKYAVKAGITIG